MKKQLFIALFCIAATTMFAQPPVVNEQLIGRPVYSNFNIKYMLFRDFNFLYKIEGDRLYLKGIDNSFNEIWVRVSE